MIFTLLGRFLQFALMFATIKVMTTLLLPEQYGLLSLYLSVNLLFGFVFINPVGTFINRNLLIWKDDGSLVSKFWLFLPYWIAVAVLSFASLWLTRLFGVSFVNEPSSALVICALFVFSSTLFNTLIPSLNLLGHDKPFIVLTVFGSLVVLFFSYLAVTYGQNLAENWVAGMLMAQLLIVVLSFGVYRKLGYRSADRSKEQVYQVVMKSIVPFAWPILVYTALIWLTFQGYRFLLEDRFSLAELGLVVAGYSVAIQIFAATEQIANTWFLPRFYAACDAKDENIRNQAAADYIYSMGLPVLLAAACIFTGIDILIKLMLGPAFQQTQIYLMIGVSIEIFRILANCVGLRFHQNNQTRKLIWPALAAFSLLFTLNATIEYSMISILLSMAICAVFLLIMMMDGALFKQIILVCRQHISIQKVLIFVGACAVLFSSQHNLKFGFHVIIWLSIWAIIGYFYLKSVWIQVNKL